MTWTIIISVLVFIFLCILITKVNIYIKYTHNLDDDLLDVNVSLWKMRVYTFSAPIIKIDSKSGSIKVEEEKKIGTRNKKEEKSITPELIIKELEKLMDFMQHIVGLHKIVRRFLKRVNVHFLNWSSDFGVGDAAYTGQLIGTVWMLKGSVIGIVGNYMKVKKKPKLFVTPHFQSVVSKTNLSCMLSFRIGHAIVAGLMLIKHWKRRPKLFQPETVENTSNV